MMDSESIIQDSVNQMGCIATQELLKTFDTDGESIQFGSVKMTTKGPVRKLYQTPYGEIDVSRHVYQTSKGGAIFCPLERDARIILASTPRFASQASHKMSEMSAPAVQKDLAINHNRVVSHRVLQRLAEAVGSIVQIKEETWSYTVPNLDKEEIKTISIGLDGTCMLMCGGAYRQAMVGTIALYDELGERRHTMYIAAPPEYGKETFKARLTREIERATALYPTALKIGVADGAHDNWDYLEQHTQDQVLDFYHATEYLSDVANTLFSQHIEHKAWLDDRCHELKNTVGAANTILAELESFSHAIKEKKAIEWSLNLNNPRSNVLNHPLLEAAKEVTRAQMQMDPTKIREVKLKSLSAAITYFKNNIVKSRMNYAEHVAANHPIGSGVTEAACKTIVKQRLGQSGMQWKDKGAGIILSLRALTHSSGRWEQFWSKVDQCGLSMAA